MTTAAQQDPIVIVGQARTPMGGFMGDLASVKATELGSTAIPFGLYCVVVVVQLMSHHGVVQYNRHQI